ncbi:hypothetical protein D9M71_631360 [compost metagenome]
MQNVVCRLVIGHQLQLQVLSQFIRQRHEAYKRVQVMCLAGYLLDAPLQLTAQPVTGQHCRAVAMGDAPQHFIQQVPALFATVARGLLQLAQQCGRDFGPERARPFRRRCRHGQQVRHRALRPGDFRRVDAMAQQHPGLVAPGGEQVVAVECDHPHNPICTGAGGSLKRARSKPLRSSAWAGR